jgi:hypothetical protein
VSDKYTWSEARLWRLEHEHVPLHQLRAMDQRSVYHQNPAKQRWLRNYVWWRALREDPILLVKAVGATVGLIGVIVGPIVGALRWYGLF